MAEAKLSKWLRFKIKIKKFFEKLIMGEASKQIFIHLVYGVIFNVALTFSIASACASHNFKERLEETIDWYLENETWLDRVTSGDYIKYYKEKYG